MRRATVFLISSLMTASAVHAQTPVNRDSVWVEWRRLARTLPQSQAVRDSLAALIGNAPKDMRDSMRARSAAELEIARDSMFTVGYGCAWPRRVLPDSVRHAQRVRIGEDICAVLERTNHPFEDERYTSESGDYRMWRAGGYTRITFRWDGHRWRVISILN